MHRRMLHFLFTALGTLVLVLAGLLPPATVAAAGPPGPPTPPTPPTPPVAGTHSPVCPGPASQGTARCFARVRTDVGAQPSPPARGPARADGTTNPAAVGANGAYDPSYLQSAYNLAHAATTEGAGRTVAIVDAYDAPTAASDLAAYRSQYGLPAMNGLPGQPTCTVTVGPQPCFQKVNQTGGTSYPQANSGWAQEISLDVDMVSAICARCNILLVEASSNSFTNLAAAVDYAAGVPGVVAISNSYGGGEFNGEASFESHYNHPGIAVTVSSGDSGYGVEFPAASQYVTAVGGTSLYQNSNNGTRDATETVWSGAGSGCSAYEPKPTWQHDTGCGRRSVADVSAVADPNTGVSVRYNGAWYIFGGTSVASPIVASMYALAGNARGTSDTLASYPYANPSNLNDITSGSNGSCGGSYLCSGAPGYDGPTGLGTANGTASFAAGSAPAPTPNFSLAASPSSQTVVAGSSATYTTTLTALNNYNSSVNLSVSGVPSGANPTFTPSSVTPTSTGAKSTLSITTSGTTPAGTYTLTITGSDSTSTTHSATVTLVVNAPPTPTSDFSLAASPSSLTVQRGKSGTYQITVAAINGSTPTVTLSETGQAGGVTASFSSNPVTPTSSAPATSTLTITANGSAKRTTRTLTITGTGADGTKHSTTVRLTVQ